MEQELKDRGIRVRVDRRTDVGLGRRLTDWELKGVPVRIEIGPRDLAEGNVSLARRERREREPVSTDGAVEAAIATVAACQESLLDEARAALGDRTIDVEDIDAAADAAQDGLARLPWDLCGPEGEDRLNRAGVSVRCVTRPDGSVPDRLDEADLLAIAARAY